MLGLMAVAEENQTIRLDLDNELEQALWVSRDFVLDALEKRTGMTKGESKQFDLGQSTDQDGKITDAAQVRLPPDRCAPFDACSPRLTFDEVPLPTS
jgi:hypothetical protein